MNLALDIAGWVSVAFLLAWGGLVFGLANEDGDQRTPLLIYRWTHTPRVQSCKLTVVVAFACAVCMFVTHVWRAWSSGAIMNATWQGQGKFRLIVLVILAGVFAAFLIAPGVLRLARQYIRGM